MLPTYFKRITASILSLVLISCGGGTEPEQQASPPARKSLDQILDSAVASGANGIFVYIDQEGKEPIATAKGIENTSTNESAMPESLFKVGSISKLFIATAASKLIALNVIKFEDTLALWLPEYQFKIENSEIITVEHLLQHRSGVPDFDSQASFSWEDSHTDIDATLAMIFGAPADFNPDAQYEYSNTNYLLLGKILDKALGYSHHDYISSDIFQPLNLTRTFNLKSEAPVNEMAHGYWNNKDRLEQEFTIPGGSMVSSAKEIGIFLKALNQGDLLTAQEREIYSRAYFFHHTGWIPGYQSIARYDSASKSFVIQFINTTGGNSESIASKTYDDIINYLKNN